MQWRTAASASSHWYGALSFDAAVRAEYHDIIGKRTAYGAGFNLEAAIQYIESQQAYFRPLGGGTDIGAKAAAAGYILSAAWGAHVGLVYQDAHDDLGAMISTTTGAPALHDPSVI